jgi:thiosulfate/3-mercaptopyruvate sulfurtransferase
MYVDLDTELSAPGGPGVGRHPLPDIDSLRAAARSWGLRNGDAVVAYDDAGGLAAARAWWLLRWAGVDDVRLLDGGLSAWVAAGHPLATGDEPGPPGDVDLSPGHLPVLDPDGVEALVASGGVLLDARSAARYRGEPSPFDPVPGHVPGAVSAAATDNLDPDGFFMPAHDLRERFAALGVDGSRAVGAYCGSGVTATHEIAALAVAGVEGVALYPGSWSQWATLGRPVATGDDPS